MTPFVISKAQPAVRQRPIAVSLALIILTIAAGLSVRFVPLGLPANVVKFGGSALWAVMIYWLSSTVLPSWRIARHILLSGVIGSAVEFLKLYDPAWLDAFRHTLPGIILLGRIFNPLDIAVYWVAIAVAAGLDIFVRLQVRRTS